MNLEEEIGRQLHGELLGIDGRIECDYMPPHREIIDPAGPIRYEAIRVVASPTLDGRVPIPDGWHLDAARCQDHAVTMLPYRTVGFEEVLLTLEVNRVEAVAFAVDGTTIQLLDHSPPDEGGQPIEAPPRAAATPVDNEDYGFDRLCRQAPILHVYRYLSLDSHVDALVAAMDSDRRNWGADTKAHGRT